MSLWNGNLCNSKVTVILDTTILIAIPIAYLPQLHRLQARSTTQGISGNFLLWNALFNGSQLSQVLLMSAYAWPTDSEPVLRQIAKGSLRGLDAYGGILGLLHSFVLWACSLILVVVYSTISTTAGTNGRSIAIQAFLYSAVIVVPALLTALPRPSRHGMGIDIMMAVLGMTHTVVTIIFVVVQFHAQLKEMRSSDGHPSTLSLPSLCLQALVVGGVALRWLSRTGRPTWNKPGGSLWMWYTWSMPIVSNGLHAIGCVILVLCYHLSIRRAGEFGESVETLPLLV